MVIRAEVVAPVAPPVKIELTGEEAKKLRRACYYNKTIASKFKGNPNGGARKADDMLSFMTKLGESLKGQGVERF